MSTPQALYKNNWQTVLLLFFMMCVVHSQVPCPTNCESCSQSGYCYGCKTGYYIFGSYSPTCLSCGTGCEKCSSSTSCDTCKSGYGTDTFSLSTSCVSCPKGCSRCVKNSYISFSSSSSGFTCSVCEPGYTYSTEDGGKCLTKSQQIGGIIGGIIGAVVFVIIVGSIIYCCCKKPAVITRTTVISSGPGPMYQQGYQQGAVYQTGPQPMQMGGPQPMQMGGPQPMQMGGSQPMNMGGPSPYNAPAPAPYAPTGPSPWGPQPTNPGTTIGGQQPTALPPGFLDQKGPSPQF